MICLASHTILFPFVWHTLDFYTDPRTVVFAIGWSFNAVVDSIRLERCAEASMLSWTAFQQRRMHGNKDRCLHPSIRHFCARPMNKSSWQLYRVLCARPSCAMTRVFGVHRLIPWEKSGIWDRCQCVPCRVWCFRAINRIFCPAHRQSHECQDLHAFIPIIECWLSFLWDSHLRCHI